MRSGRCLNVRFYDVMFYVCLFVLILANATLAFLCMMYVTGIPIVSIGVGLITLALELGICSVILYFEDRDAVKIEKL